MNRRTLIKKTAAGVLGIFSLSGCQKEIKNNNNHQKDELTELTGSEIISLYREYFGIKRVEYALKKNSRNEYYLNITVWHPNSTFNEKIFYTNAKEHLSNSRLRKDVEIDIKYVDRWLKS